jgi:hypothetical protein
MPGLEIRKFAVEIIWRSRRAIARVTTVAGLNPDCAVHRDFDGVDVEPGRQYGLCGAG